MKISFDAIWTPIDMKKLLAILILSFLLCEVANAFFKKDIKAYLCNYEQGIFNNPDLGKTGDPYIDNLPSDWNDVRVHGIDNVLRHYAFTDHFNDKSWNDEKKCSPVCYEKCRPEGEMHLTTKSVNKDRV